MFLGVGVEHDLLVNIGESLFRNQKPIWEENPKCLLEKIPPKDVSLAQYTGGELRVK